MTISMSSAVFLESADSVRFAPARDRDLRKRHLEMEVLLALLFGERIGISGAYSFDSSGFLEVAAELVRKGRDQRGVARTPVLLGLLPGIGSFRDYVAAQVGLPKEKFVLSGWPSLSDDQERRNDFARRFLSSDPHSVTQLVGRGFEMERVEDLLTLASYFDPSTVSTARIPEIKLASYVDGLQALRLDPFSPAERDSAALIVDGIHTLRARGVILDNRSDVRVRRPEIQEWLGAEVYDGILEFVDTCYNQVLHDSLGTRAGVFSSRITDSQGLGVIGEQLAYVVRDTLLGSGARRGRSELSLKIAADPTLVPAGDGVDEKLRKAGRVHWKDVLELVASPEFQRSIEQVRLSRSAGRRDDAERRLADHIELVAPTVRPYRLVPDESGIRLALLGEYRFDRAKASLGAVTGAVGPILEYAISGHTGLASLGLGVAVGMATGIVRSPSPVPPGESAREIIGTVETLTRSVRIE